MAKNEAKVRFTAETSEFTREIKEMNSQITTVRAALKLNAEQMKSSADNTELLKERQKLLTTELNDSQEKTRLLSEKLQKAVEIYGEDSTEVQKLTTQLYNAQAAEEKIKQEIEQTNQALEKSEQEQQQVITASQQLTGKIGEQEEELSKLKEQYVDVTLEQGKTSTEAQELAGKISALNEELNENKDKLSSAQQDADGLTEALDEAGKGAEQAANGGFTVFKGILANLASEGLQRCITGLKDFAGSVLETGMDFEAGMSQVAAISGATGEELEALKAKASEMGKTTKFTATESAEAMNYMAMAGWETEDMLSGIEGIMNLAAASGEDLATTSDIVTDALTAFGMTADDSSHFADVLAASSAAANTNVGMLGESFKYAASVAGSLGYSAEDTSVALGLMANAGIKASQGGTSLRSILTNLASPTDTVAGAMDDLGISLQNEDGSAKSLAEVMQNLRDAFGGCQMPMEEFQTNMDFLTARFESGEISEKKYNEAVEELTERAYGAEGALKAKYAAAIAGKQGMSGLLAITNATEEDFNKLTEAVEGATDATTGYSAANEMAKEMQDNLQGDITLMQSAFDGFKQSIYEDIDGPLREAVQGITSDFIPAAQNMYEGIKAGGQWLREHKGLVMGVAVVLGSLTAGIAAYNVVTGIKTAMEAVEATSLLGLAKAQLGLNTAMLANPVTLIVAGITAIVAGIVLLWNNCEGFRNFWKGAWEGIKGVFPGVKEKLGETADAAKEKFNGIKESAKEGLNGLKNYTQKELMETKKTFEEHGGGIKGAAAVAMRLSTEHFRVGYDAINTLTKGKLGETVNAAKEKFNGIKENANKNLGTLKLIAQKELIGMIGIFKSNGGGLKGAAAASMKLVNDVWRVEFTALNKLTGGKLGETVKIIKEKISSVKTEFQEGVDKIKSIFDFKLKAPDIKMPQITVTYSTSGPLAEAAKFLGLSGLPKFGIKWNAEGAILTQPTIFGFAGGMLQGGGEAGKEAVLPIDTLQDYIENSMAKFVAAIPQIDYDQLGQVIVDGVRSQETKMVLNQREVGRIVREAPSW